MRRQIEEEEDAEDFIEFKTFSASREAMTRHFVLIAIFGFYENRWVS